MKKIFLCISALLLSVSLAGCADSVSSNTYSGSDVGVASTVKKGVVVSRRIVVINNNSGMGGLAGLGAGAVAGSAIGGSSTAHLLGAVGGAVAGGLIGNEIDRSVNSHKAFEYIIKLRHGSTISVVQAMNVRLEVNQPVLVMFGPKTRIVPDTQD